MRQITSLVIFFGFAPLIHAAVVSATFDLDDNELLSFSVAGGRTYSQSDLIQPTLTAFAGGGGNGQRNIWVKVGGDLPESGSRSRLLTHDFYVDTGITNPAERPTAATLQFSSPLVNGPGPDLVLFEMEGSEAPDSFAMQINGTTVTFDRGGTDWGPLLLAGVSVDRFSRDAGTPNNITQLEYGSYSPDRSANGNIYGIAIDLDEFGINPLDSVTTVNFGAFNIGPATNIDPTLVMGIRSVAVPEPSAFALLGIGSIQLLTMRRR